MTLKEAIEWLRGNRCSTNCTPSEPLDTWHVRICQANAALTQQAYYIVKAWKEGLLEEQDNASDG